MPIGQRALVTMLWLAATAGMFVVSMVSPDGLAHQVTLVAALSMALTFLALLFLLLAEIFAPSAPPAPRPE